MKRLLDLFRLASDEPLLPKSKRQQAPQPKYEDLPPSLADNLKVIFVGYNPGEQLLIQQHHYAHFTNRFWKLLNELELLVAVDENIPAKYASARPEHDYELVEYGVGFTDLVLRCTKRADQLLPSEKMANVPRLVLEFAQAHVKFVVFIGKGIWEVVVKYVATKTGVKARDVLKLFEWGLQDGPVAEYLADEVRKGGTDEVKQNTGDEIRHDDKPNADEIKEEDEHESNQLDTLESDTAFPRIYVFPNTLGLVTTMTHAQKLALWTALVADIRLYT